MSAFSGHAKYVLVGVALLAFASGSAFSQIPTEITLTRNAVNRIVGDLDSYVATLVSKCDKCESSTKSGSQKAVSALRGALNDLAKATDGKYSDLAKACK